MNRNPRITLYFISTYFAIWVKHIAESSLVWSQDHLYNIIFFKKIIYLFILAEFCLQCCGDFSLVAESGGYSLVAVLGLLIAVAFLVEGQGF